MRVKTCPAKLQNVTETKAEDGSNAGEFEAIVSAFGNTDAVGDVVLSGAFEKSLTKWNESGDPIPVIWSHDHQNPDAHIGMVQEAKETDAGLWVKGTIDLDEPFAAKVHRLLKARRVTKFSFAYDMIDYEENDKGGFDLKELDLWEVGPTLIPANDETDLLAIKNLLRNEQVDLRDFAKAVRDFNEMAKRGVKAGRVLSAKNEALLKEVADQIRDSATKIGDLLKSVQADSSGDDGKAREEQPTTNNKPAESKGSKPEETRHANGSESANGTSPADNDLLAALGAFDETTL